MNSVPNSVTNSHNYYEDQTLIVFQNELYSPLIQYML